MNNFDLLLDSTFSLTVWFALCNHYLPKIVPGAMEGLGGSGAFLAEFPGVPTSLRPG